MRVFASLAIAALAASGCAGHRGTDGAGVVNDEVEGAAPPPDGPCTTQGTQTLVDGEDVESLAVDDTSVYYATTDDVRRVARTGGESPVQLATGGMIRGLAVDDTNFYYVGTPTSGTSDGPRSIYAVPIGGGSAKPRSVRLADFFTGAVAGTLVASGIESLTLAAGPDESFGDRVTVEAVAVGRTAIYATTSTLSSTGVSDGAVVRIPRDGSATTKVVTGLVHPSAIVLDADHLYFSEANDFATANWPIYRAGLDGSALTKLVVVEATNLQHMSLAVDAHALYTTSDRAILRVDLASGVMTTVASAVGPGLVRVRGGNVYWANGAQGFALSDTSAKPYGVMTACK